jgi:hypothetical protein
MVIALSLKTLRIEGYFAAISLVLVFLSSALIESG